MKNFSAIFLALAATALAGCSTYSWRSEVPQDMRTVLVPVFRNESSVTGLGSEITRQIAREFEREGTLEIAPAGEAALEVQGIVKEADSGAVAYGRKSGQRNREYRLRAEAVVSFVDKKSGRVIVDNRRYVASAPFMAGDDMLTGERDASGRLAEDMARRIVDDVLNELERLGRTNETEELQ